MTPESLRAAAGRLDTTHERYADCFGRSEARQHSRVYVRGLLLCEQRKTCEAIALRFAMPRDGCSPSRREVQAMQHFLTESPWDYQRVQATTQAIFAEELAPSAAASPVGVVGVIDESGDEKSGRHSCGAGTQWFGRLGKTEVCQVGVFLVGVVPQGTALLDHQLFLPQDWASDQARRKKTHVPRQFRFRTKPQIAVEMIERTLANGHVRFDWITADSLYGKSSDFLASLERRQQKYVVETASNITFWTCDPATQIPTPSSHGGPRPTRPTRDSVRSAEVIAAALPSSAWQPIKLREGTKGPLVAQFARVRVWRRCGKQPGPPVWLVFRRELESLEVKYYVSNAAEDVPLETLALVIATRWRVEEFLEDAKEYLGLADYEARGWTSWHHHMSLVGIAHLYVTLIRKDLRDEAPELSLDQAYRLVCDAMSRPTLTPEESLRITEYHLHYNHQAHQSHRKSWLRRHQRQAQELRL
jgi:SRSO17 transposase